MAYKTMDKTETTNLQQAMLAFGPVPSRRLGRSIGINHIPPKTCTYSCVYCQVGHTTRLTTTRQAFYALDAIIADVERKVDDARAAGERVDYLTFVPDGEPTLDINLRGVMERLKPLGIKIAVISNGSLLWQAEVRETLSHADWVSVKVDAVQPDIWHRVNRPHGSLRLDTVLKGLLTFAGGYRGELATETMLVRDANDDAAHLAELADFLRSLRPAKAYLAVPTRPPAEPWVRLPAENVINRSYQQLQTHLEHVELLIGYEGNAFSATGDPAQDLLSITAVHPMREDAVQEFLTRVGATTAVMHELVGRGQLVETTYEGRRFYTRRLPGVPTYS